jgi:phosphatidylglycerophosphate synthase
MMISPIIQNWTTFHALLILIATAFCFLLSDTVPLIIISVLSFTLLILLTRKQWTPGRYFGWGNLLTSLRLLVLLFTVLFFRGLPNYFIALAGLVILIGDGIDGRVARQRKELSEFGEYFDKETDALFIHLFCLSAIFKDLLGEWIILIGLLRYLFVIYLFLTGKKDNKERRSKAGRHIFVFVSCSVIIFFLPFPRLPLAVSSLSLLLLIYSFGRDILWIQFGK